jgi:hypothetical protein
MKRDVNAAPESSKSADRQEAGTNPSKAAMPNGRQSDATPIAALVEPQSERVPFV